VIWAAASALAVPIVALGGVPSFWIDRTLRRIETQLDHLERTVLRDHGDRIARLERRKWLRG
jgi:hypothetical protein